LMMRDIELKTSLLTPTRNHAVLSLSARIAYVTSGTRSSVAMG
jgi:hypothetical protein